MYTQCPHCETYFALSAVQLRSGRGWVRCGECRKPFDALSTLEDGHPATAPRAEAEPVSELQDMVPESPDASPDADSREEGDSAEPALELSRQPDLELDLASQPARAPDGAEDVPDVLREDIRRLARARYARSERMFYTAGALLLLLTLTLQYVWFAPEKVMAHYPGARPWVVALCEHTGCRLAERRDATRVLVVSRDVRVHPGYEGALLLTATLVNAAPFTQDYPRMQFTLFNVNGQSIATRRFEPAEYLGPKVDVSAGMAPKRPVQVELEFLAPEQVAVSFEFRFL